MVSVTVVENRVIISGSDAAAFFAELQEKHGSPPLIKNEKGEAGYLYQGFYISFRPEI
jgi:hypothetical protein